MYYCVIVAFWQHVLNEHAMLCYYFTYFTYFTGSPSLILFCATLPFYFTRAYLGAVNLFNPGLY